MAGGEGDDRGWDGWMATPTQWIWVWVNSGFWWWRGRPGVLQSMGLQSRTRLSDWTELNWTELNLVSGFLSPGILLSVLEICGPSLTGCSTNKEALVCDPGREPERLVRREMNGLTAEYYRSSLCYDTKFTSGHFDELQGHKSIHIFNTSHHADIEKLMCVWNRALNSLSVALYLLYLINDTFVPWSRYSTENHSL